MVSPREEELERKLQEKEREFWERFWKQWDSLVDDVKQNKKDLGIIKGEIKIIALRIAALIAAGVYALEFLIKKYLD